MGACYRWFGSLFDLLQLRTQGGLPRGFFTPRESPEDGLELEFSALAVILLGFSPCSCCSSSPGDSEAELEVLALCLVWCLALLFP